MSDAIPNPELRQHVTRVGFDLSLPKTAIGALVIIDNWTQQDDGIMRRIHDARRAGNNSVLLRAMDSGFIGGARALQYRGLVTHTPSKDKRTDRPMRSYWKLTKAGRLVRDLLKESGVWDDFLAEIPPAEVPA